MSLYEFLILGIYLFLLFAFAVLVQTDAYPRVAAEKLRILLPSTGQDHVEEEEEEEEGEKEEEEEEEEEFTMTENPMFVHREEANPIEKED
jgi:hypothetical protein